MAASNVLAFKPVEREPFIWRRVNFFEGVALAVVPDPSEEASLAEAMEHWRLDVTLARRLCRMRPPTEVLLRLMKHQLAWSVWLSRHSPDAFVRSHMAMAAEEYRVWLAREIEKRRRRCH